jgi:tetratricopeptide (TPR) repeat protein
MVRADLLTEMDPVLVSSRICAKLIIEVDCVRGSEPDEQALRGLVDVARALLPGKSVRLFIDDVIPDESWPDPANEASFDRIASRWLDTLPQDDREAMYVLYVPKSAAESRLAGYARDWVIDRGGGPLFVPGMYVDLGVIEDNALPFASRESLELYTLAHEFGHVIGLVSNPRHAQLHSSRHCTHTGCVMHSIGNRRLLGHLFTGLPGAFLPKRFCDECQADLHAVRAYAATASTKQLAHDRLVHAARAISAWHRRHHRRTRAVEVLREALQAAPSNPHLAFQLARALAGEGRVGDALRVIGAVPRQRRTESMQASFGHYLCRSGEYEAALEVLPKKSGNFSKDDVRARVWALEGCGEYGEALEVLGEYADARGVPRGERRWNDQRAARLLIRAGRFDSARDSLRSVPGYPRHWSTSTLLLSADVAEGRGDPDRAATDLRHARQRLSRFLDGAEDQRSPRVLLARYTLLETLARQGDAAAFSDSLADLQFPPNFEDVHRRFHVSLRHRFARALSRGRETARAMELLARAAAWEYPRGPSDDPCLDRGFEALRRLDDFEELYPSCHNERAVAESGAAAK